MRASPTASRASPVPSHRLCLLHRRTLPELASPWQGLWDTQRTPGSLQPGCLSPLGLPLWDLHADPVVHLPLPLETGGPAHTVIAHALWPAAWPSSHSVSMVIATPVLCSVFCVVYLLLKDWGPGPWHLFSCPSLGSRGADSSAAPHGAEGVQVASRWQLQEKQSWAEVGTGPLLQFSLSIPQLRLCSVPPMEQTVWAQGSSVSTPPLHPGSLAWVQSSRPWSTGPSLVLDCRWWLSASRQMSPPDPQPSPLPESRNLVLSLLTSQAAGPQRQRQGSCEGHMAVCEGLKCPISGHFFQVAPRDHQARMVRKGGVGSSLVA